MTESYTVRTVNTYDVKDDVKRWSGWTFLPVPLAGVMKEAISAKRKTALICQEWYERDEDGALAHVIAHLDLGHHEAGGKVSAEEEAMAEWLARVRLDREGTRG
jgi:hypothetical protein